MVGAALLALLPVWTFNPELARGALQWMELVLLLVVPLVVLRRRWWLGWLWLVVVMGVVGWLVSASRPSVLLVVLGVMLVPAVLARARTGAGLLGASLVAAGLMAGHALGLRVQQPERQVVLIGLDAASWDIIDPLRAAGRMPTFDRLVRGGTRGELATFFPVVSPPLWTTIATGMKPEKHGIRDFWGNSDQVQAKRIWEIADERGKVSGVLGYLVTWPPHKANGFLVPGWDAQGIETVPPELSFLKALEIGEKQDADASPLARAGLIAQALRHGATLSTINRAAGGMLARLVGAQRPLEYALEGRLLKLDLTADVFCQLLRTVRVDFASYYYSSIDAIEHEFFKYFRPEGFPDLAPEKIAEFGDAIPRVYEETDRALGRILRWTAPDAHLVVVSDHGQRPVKREGAKWYRIRTSKLEEVLGIGDDVRATNIGSEAYLRPARGHEGYRRALDAVRSIVVASDGQPLFRIREHGTEEASVTVRSDLGDDEAVPVRFGERTLRASDLLDGSERISGEHTDTAMILLAGPDVVAGHAIPKGTLADVAPTVLALLGLPVSREMDGVVLGGAFRPEAMERLAVTYVDSYGKPAHAATVGEGIDQQKLETLRALGYVE
jgi:hypothetical protein